MSQDSVFIYFPVRQRSKPTSQNEGCHSLTELEVNMISSLSKCYDIPWCTVNGYGFKSNHSCFACQILVYAVSVIYHKKLFVKTRPQENLNKITRVIVRASDGQSVRRVNVSGDWSKRPM